MIHINTSVKSPSAPIVDGCQVLVPLMQAVPIDHHPGIETISLVDPFEAPNSKSESSAVPEDLIISESAKSTTRPMAKDRYVSEQRRKKRRRQKKRKHW